MTDNMGKITDKEKELVDGLKEAGLSKNQAKALITIAKDGPITSRKIEDQTALRQPEASIAITELKERGWVSKGKKNREGRGRPVHIYSLGKDFSAILDEIEDEEKEKIRDIEVNLQNIKDMAEKEDLV